MRGITTRIGPLGVEDDEEDDPELIDITLGGQLDPRCYLMLMSKISKIHPCRTLLRAAPASDDEVVFEDFELALEVIHTKTVNNTEIEFLQYLATTR